MPRSFICCPGAIHWVISRADESKLDVFVGGCDMAPTSKILTSPAAAPVMSSRSPSQAGNGSVFQGSTLSSYCPREPFPDSLEYIGADLLFNSPPGPLWQMSLVVSGDEGIADRPENSGQEVLGPTFRLTGALE